MTTAVEWLEKQLTDAPYIHFGDLFEQAKQIEKKQIMDAYLNNGWNDGDDRADAEQYYNETYRSNETREEALQFLATQAQEMGLYNTPIQTEMKLSAVKYLSDAILSKRYNIDVFELHDAIQNAYLIEKELINKEISDEEIKEALFGDQFDEQDSDDRSMLYGAKWYREQLKQMK